MIPRNDATQLSLVTPGKAYWNQRLALAESKERILALSATVGRSSDLTLYQFGQLLALALEFQPDLILELGRFRGNSTCAFTEAANQLSVAARCRVLSLCLSSKWRRETEPKLRAFLPEEWFQPVTAVTGDILRYDFRQALRGAQRVLLFWDAHGFEVAECVLGGILPEIADKPHIVAMHDLSDIRYGARTGSDYAGRRLWKGENAGEPRLRVGIIDSAVGQSIAVQDFASRNEITLDSADHSIHVEVEQVPGRTEEMKTLLGEDVYSPVGHWFWFTLNQRPRPYTFPRYVKPARSSLTRVAELLRWRAGSK